MKGIKGGGSAAGSASLASPAIVVVLVLLIGATLYLWRARYIRRRTAFMWIAVYIIVLAALAGWMYLHPMSDLGP
jgi:hypothetical protein